MQKLSYCQYRPKYTTQRYRKESCTCQDAMRGIAWEHPGNPDMRLFSICLPVLQVVKAYPRSLLLRELPDPVAAPERSQRFRPQDERTIMIRGSGISEAEHHPA